MSVDFLAGIGALTRWPHLRPLPRTEFRQGYSAIPGLVNDEPYVAYALVRATPVSGVWRPWRSPAGVRALCAPAIAKSVSPASKATSTAPAKVSTLLRVARPAKM